MILLFWSLRIQESAVNCFSSVCAAPTVQKETSPHDIYLERWRRNILILIVHVFPYHFCTFFQWMFLTNKALFSFFLLISEMKWYFYILLNGTVSYTCTDILQEQWLCNLHNSLKAHNGISNHFIIFTIFIPCRDICRSR